MAQNKITIIVDGLRQVQALEKSLRNISRLADKVNGTGGGSKVNKTLQEETKIQRILNQIETKRNQLFQLDVKSAKVSAVKGRLTKAENLANKGKIAEAEKELAIGTKRLTILKGQTAEIVKQNKASAKMEAIRQGNFAGSGPGVFGPQPRRSFAQRFGPTRGFDFGSALIGGGFPLLFGGGPLQAAAGALGGGIGGMFGKGGGFAGSIAATAVVQTIQQAVTAIADLGKALGPFTQNTEAVINSLGLQGSAQQAQLQLIEQVEGKTVAFNAAMKIMASRITQDGVDKLTNFGNNTRLLGQQFTIAVTKLQAFAAGIANLVLRLTGLQNALKEREATRAVGDAAALGNTTAKSLVKRRESAEQLRGQGGDASRKEALLEQIKIEERIFAVQQAVSVEVDQLTSKSADLILQKQKELDLNKRIEEITKTGVNQELAKSIAEIEQIFDSEQKVLLAKQEQAKTAYENAIISTNDKTLQSELLTKYLEITNQLETQNKLKGDAIGLQENLNKTTDKYKVSLDEVKDVLASGMTNAIMGLIDGTKTLSESLAGIAKQLASMFLNAAFKNIFSGLLSEQGSYSRAGGFKAFQYGGVVNSPTLGMIGEGGEPEYVIPASKMDGAMARYSAGARGGAVIPGGSHESGTVAGSSGNAIVEYTGPVLNFNGDDYVPKSAVPEIIGAASKQGAMAGKAQTFNALKNSRSQRASLGL